MLELVSSLMSRQSSPCPQDFRSRMIPRAFGADLAMMRFAGQMPSRRELVGRQRGHGR